MKSFTSVLLTFGFLAACGSTAPGDGSSNGPEDAASDSSAAGDSGRWDGDAAPRDASYGDASDAADAADANVAPRAPWTDTVLTRIDPTRIDRIFHYKQWLLFTSRAGATVNDGWIYRCEIDNCSRTMTPLSTVNVNFPVQGFLGDDDSFYLTGTPQVLNVAPGATSGGVWSGFGARLQLANDRVTPLPALYSSLTGTTPTWLSFRGPPRPAQASYTFVGGMEAYVVGMTSIETASSVFSSTFARWTTTQQTQEWATLPFSTPPNAGSGVQTFRFGDLVCGNQFVGYVAESSRMNCARLRDGSVQFFGVSGPASRGWGDVGGSIAFRTAGALQVCTNPSTCSPTATAGDVGEDILGTDDWVESHTDNAGIFTFTRIKAASLTSGPRVVETSPAFPPAKTATIGVPQRKSLAYVDAVGDVHLIAL